MVYTILGKGVFSLSQIRGWYFHLNLDMSTGLWLTHNNNFGGYCRFLTGVWHLDLDLDMVTDLWCPHVPNFGTLSWVWSCKEHLCLSSPHLGLWRMLEAVDWGWTSWSWFGYGHWSLLLPCCKCCHSILILRVQRTSMSFKTWLWALEDATCSWLGFIILIFIWIWSLVFGTQILRILALYLDFESAKNIHVL